MAQKRIPSSEAFQRTTLPSSAWLPQPTRPAVSYSDANAVQTTQPCIFYLCNKPIFRSLICVSLNHNIPIEKNLIILFTFEDREGRRKKKFIINLLFLFVGPNSSPTEICMNLNSTNHEEQHILFKTCTATFKTGYPENDLIVNRHII